MKTLACCFVVILLLSLAGCSRVRHDLDYDYAVEQTWTIDDPKIQIVQFESVPWRPLNTETLRQHIRDQQSLDSRNLLEIGAATGFFAIVCAREGAKRVVAVTNDRASEACARYNVAADDLDSIIEVKSLAGDRATGLAETDSPAKAAATDRSVLTQIVGDDRFDFIVLGTESLLPTSLILEVLEELPSRLSGGGRCWVICPDAQIEQTVREHTRSLQYHVTPLGETVMPQAAEAAYPRTLQIDPFASGSGGADSSPLPDSPAQR